MPAYKKKIAKKDVPSEFDSSTVNTIKRIEKNSNVVGVMHFHRGNVQLCTAPESMTLILTKKIPTLTSTIHYSIGEIDILDELVAYRIVTNSIEIMAVADKEFTSCVIQRLTKQKQPRKQHLKGEII
ncbi:uncharacterized protein LOC126777126 [Nymphalis io]|uniref:uncharacterized protein LOC126777126 n=1 Tax=Inachis io TaxID=171585 RepID=UPI002168EF91|nr:uncharacterized protein LOC126777126 [Nymphalis io]